MVEAIKQSLRDSKSARWTALAIVSFTLLCGYYFTDVMAPLKPMIEQQLGWTSSQYGFFTSAYAWFNVFLAMLVFGGMILDRMGPRFTGILATSLMILGALLKFWAVNSPIIDGAMLFGWPKQVMMASIGFAIFGVGVEIVGITVSKIIVKWFKGKEMALAMGLNVAAGRIGTALAMMLPLPIAKATNISMPLALGLVLLCVGLVAFIIYCIQDRKLEASEASDEKEAANKEDAFKLSDIGLIVKSTGFWLVAVLCVLFYSAVFPFLKYATDLMIQKYNVSPGLAGILPGLLPFGNILMTPFFGNLYDRKGKGATIMMVGSILLIIVHGVFSLPINNWVLALLAILVLGVGFSLVPSAMWPSVPKIIPEKQLGTAYAMIFFIQNIGLGGVPALIGWVLDKYCKTGVFPDGAPAYDYTKPMLIFMCFGILALFVSFILKMDDKRKGYGLELPNIKK